jgi:NAD(P)-dependent dehydrogenase (short-subunit alcohol dehydrogenase family)
VTQQLAHKTALVTGGTDGIGRAIAQSLAARGIQVAVVGRDAAKGRRAEQEIRAASQNSSVFFHQADLSLTSECRRLSAEIQSQWPVLHYVVHSAGVIRGRHELTVEGVETNFASNYLSRFALTQPLIPLLSATGTPENPARVLIISGAAQNGKIHFDDINLTRNFSVIRAVLQFCHANDLYTAEITERLRADGQAPTVAVTCLKVGVVRTPIRRGFPFWMRALVALVLDPLLGQTPEEVAEAAMTLLVGANAQDVAGGLFIKIKQLRRTNSAGTAIAGKQRQRLWDLSERLLAHPPATHTYERQNT